MSQIEIRSHYHAAALVEMQLPSLPSSKGKILEKAEREGWPFVTVPCRGGRRREYVPSAPIMEEIRAKAAAQVLAVATPAPKAVPRKLEQLSLVETEEQALKADARKGVLLALQLLMNRSGYPMKKAARTLIEMAREGKAEEQLVKMLKMARDGRGRISVDGLPSERSVLRFVEYERAGMLAPKKPQRDMTVPAWAQSFMAHYQKPEKPTVEHAYRQFLQELEDTADAPSVWQVRRFLDKVGKVALEVGRMGDRELKSLKPFVRRGFEQLLPTDIYSADGHTFDAEVQHPLHGRPFRPEITSVVDIATRRAVGWSIGLAESALTVLDSIRDATLRAGIPAILYVDNGSGYRNELMSEVGIGLLSRLGTEMIHSLPYNSQARGVIERLHQTIWVNAAKELPGYIGKDMDRQAKLNVFKLSRQAIAKRAQTAAMPLIGWELFLQFCEAKVAEYNDRPHRSLSKIADPANGRRRHMTPNEAWALAVEKGFEAHMVTDDESRPLFRPQALRTVRRCEIELFGNRYFAGALEEFHGEQLRVGYDIHDPALIWVYQADGRFVCKAELDGNKRDYMPRSVVEQARDKRAAGRERRLEVKLEEVQLERRGHPVLEQAETIVIPGFMTINREQLAERARLAETAELAEPTVAPAPVLDPMPAIAEWKVPDSPAERFAEWQRLNNLREEELDCEKQKKWRHTYQETAEFRTYQRRTA